LKIKNDWETDNPSGGPAQKLAVAVKDKVFPPCREGGKGQTGSHAGGKVKKTEYQEGKSFPTMGGVLGCTKWGWVVLRKGEGKGT